MACFREHGLIRRAFHPTGRAASSTALTPGLMGQSDPALEAKSVRQRVQEDAVQPCRKAVTHFVPVGHNFARGPQSTDLSACFVDTEGDTSHVHVRLHCGTLLH